MLREGWPPGSEQVAFVTTGSGNIGDNIKESCKGERRQLFLEYIGGRGNV